MHIAVCMDDAPDRKQLERLLSRSADRRLESDPSQPYYVQSFGNKEALLRRPHMYDLIFIDLLHDDIDSIELIRILRDMKVMSTIVLCPGRVDLSDRLDPEDRILIMRQPVKVDDLEAVLDQGLKDMAAREPRIEIRAKDETYRIKEEDFLYAEQVKDAVLVHLADGREILCPEELGNFRYKVENFEHIFYLPDSLVAHRQSIDSVSFGKVILKDGRKFKASHKWIKYMEQNSIR